MELAYFFTPPYAVIARTGVPLLCFLLAHVWVTNICVYSLCVCQYGRSFMRRACRLYRFASHNDVSVNDGLHIRRWSHNTVLFEMIVGVLTTCHLVLQTQPHVISFCGVTSRIRFMFLLFPQVSRN